LLLYIPSSSPALSPSLSILEEALGQAYWYWRQMMISSSKKRLAFGDYYFDGVLKEEHVLYAEFVTIRTFHDRECGKKERWSVNIRLTPLTLWTMQNEVPPWNFPHRTFLPNVVLCSTLLRGTDYTGWIKTVGLSKQLSKLTKLSKVEKRRHSHYFILLTLIRQQQNETKRSCEP
jgi:hypothetical protein